MIEHEIGPLSRDLRVRLAAYAGILCAYLAAVSNDPLLPALLGLFGAAALWSLAVEHRLARPFFPAPVKIGLIGLGAGTFVILVAGGTAAGTEMFANAISRFLFWNAIVFVLSRNKSEYDFWTIAIIQLSLFMISGSFIQPPRFLPLLLGSVVCLLYTFQRIALLKCGQPAEPLKGGLLLLGVTLFLVLETGAAVFVLFPRSAFRAEKTDSAGAREAPPEGPPVQDGPDATGIPRSAAFLKLQNFQKLKTDPTAVLKVRVRDLEDRPVPADRTQYLRGAVLDVYEAGEWKTSFRRLPRADADDGGGDGWTTLEASPPKGRLVVRQQIRTSALSEDLSFSLPDPVRVQWKDAKYDPAGVLFFSEPPRGMIEYHVESALQPSEIPPRPSRGAVPESYLQVPAGLGRLKESARRIVASVSEGRHARVSRLVHHLTHNGFAYRLDPFVAPPGRDPVEHFLEGKTGYCVQYASALTLLCRAVGIPARVATGFQLHDPQEDGSFIVRNSDAHAWVEVWYGAEFGWRSYDATPESSADAPPLPEGKPVATGDVNKRKEEPKAQRWDSLIMDFDPAVQNRAFGRTVRNLGGLLEALLRALFRPAALLGLAALAALGGLAWLLLPRRQKNRLRQIVSGFRETTNVDFYRDFLWILSRRGLRRHPSLTAWEFARQVRARFADEGVDFVVDKFYEQRFRGTSPSPEDRVRIDGILERLRRPPATAP